MTWGERRLANVHKLIRLARRFEAQEGRDLRGFLDHIAHLERAAGAREADAPVGDPRSRPEGHKRGPGSETEAVRLMSIHAAKGLEFPVVCVADLGRDPNLRYPDLLLDGEGARVGLRLLELSATPSRLRRSTTRTCAIAGASPKKRRRTASSTSPARVPGIGFS